MSETSAASLTPVHTAFLTRGDERLWIHSYAEPAMVVLTYPAVALAGHPRGELPGLVRELHTRRGDSVALGMRFAAEVDRHAADGWRVRRASILHVWSGDPWTVPSVLDAPCPF